MDTTTETVRGPVEKNAGYVVKVMFHGCPHDFQDKRYGKQQRVFNKTKTGWRCTVCGGTAS